MEVQKTFSFANAPRHTESPFWDSVQINTKKKRRKAKAFGVSGDFSSALKDGVAEITEVVTVDADQFVKVFIGSVGAGLGLSQAGQKVWYLLIEAVQTQALGRDTVYLSWSADKHSQFGISQKTFYRGISELTEMNVIAKEEKAHVYFINPAMIFNGDRLKFVRELRKKKADERVDASNKKGRLAVAAVDTDFRDNKSTEETTV